MVFLPSHLFLEQVYNSFMEAYYDADTMECIVQEDYMSEAQREEFCSGFGEMKTAVSPGTLPIRY